jgi:hypothetical protein
MQDEDDSSESRLVKELERSHGIHLREVLLPPRPLLGGTGAEIDAGTRYTGLAVANALRTLRVACTVEGMVGIIICEAKDLTAWLVRRCGSRPGTRPLHPAGNPAKNDPFFENTAR